MSCSVKSQRVWLSLCIHLVFNLDLSVRLVEARRTRHFEASTHSAAEGLQVLQESQSPLTVIPGRTSCGHKTFRPHQLSIGQLPQCQSPPTSPWSSLAGAPVGSQVLGTTPSTGSRDHSVHGEQLFSPAWSSSRCVTCLDTGITAWM